jgi:hypothetical protein
MRKAPEHAWQSTVHAPQANMHKKKPPRPHAQALAATGAVFSTVRVRGAMIF